jgi:hypothetical protein
MLNTGNFSDNGKSSSQSDLTDSKISETQNCILPDKRIRKKKKFDDDFVQFDSVASTSSNKRAKHDDSQQHSYDTQTLIEPMYVDNLEVDGYAHTKGDLVWAKVSGHPWWPCMVSSFPPAIGLNEIESDDQDSSHVKLVGNVKLKKVLFVLFFETCEHAWVSENFLIKYKDRC